MKTLRDFNRDLSNKNSCRGKQVIQCTSSTKGKKYIGNLKKKILGMAKNDPISKSKMFQFKRVSQKESRNSKADHKCSSSKRRVLSSKSSSHQQKGKDEGGKGVGKGEKGKEDDGGKLPGKEKEKEQYRVTGSRRFCSVVMFGSSTWPRSTSRRPPTSRQSTSQKPTARPLLISVRTPSSTTSTPPRTA